MAFSQSLAKKIVLSLFLTLTLLSLPSPTWAHSSVERTIPEDSSRVEKFDGKIYIDFNEKISLTKKSSRLVNSSGTEIETSAQVLILDNGGSRLEVASNTKIINGWYALLYEVLAQDGHTTTGTITFLVGPDTDSAKASIKDPAALYKKLGDIFRFLGYLTSILAIGLLITSWVLDKNLIGKKNIVRTFSGTIAFAGLLIAPLTLLNFTLLLNAGSFEEFKSVFLIALESSVGTSILVRVSSLFALSTAILLASEKSTRKISYIIGLIGAIGIATSFSFQGHSTVVPHSNLAKILLSTHLLAAGAWLGGMPGLYWFFRNKANLTQKDLFEIIKRFSIVASTSVFTVLLAGTALGFLMFTKPSDLTTKYGLSLLVKFFLVLLVALVGAFNHFKLLPSIESGLEKDENSKNFIRLKRSLGVETIGLVMILLATAFLTTSGAPAAGNNHGLVGHSHGADLSNSFASAPEVLQGVLGDGGIEISLSPAVMNQKISVTAKVTNAIGKQSPAESITLFLSNKVTGIGPLKREMVKQKDGSFILTTRDLAISGEWEIKAIVRVNTVETLQSSVTAVIAPDALNSNNSADLGFDSVTPIIDQSQSKIGSK